MSALDDLHLDLQALVGTVIHDRYRVDELLGAGGMGAVFKGHHLALQRDVAIKVLRPELGRDPTIAKRFDREALSVSRLDHPNCVRVTDYGTTADGMKYLVMELLQGTDLDASLGQPWTPVRAVETITQILEGLAHAHEVGIVHRDLKPENVFVTRDHRGNELFKLVDFGIAKLIDEQGASEELTRVGTVFGTPCYMSPEQASGGKLDERTDLYAAGLLLYEMLSGQPPFMADESAALLRMHILSPPPELPASVPAPLAAVVGKLLEKSRNNRYASAREVIDVLEQLRPNLDATPAAGPASNSSPRMAFEPTDASMDVVVPPVPPLNRRPVSGPRPVPAWPPGMTGESAADKLTPPPAVQPSNSPTGAGGDRPSRRWLARAIVGSGILLALLAFVAWQVLQSRDDQPLHSASTRKLAHAPPVESAPVGTTFDGDCSDNACECRGSEACELSCGRACDVRCVGTGRCDVEVGDGSKVLCDGSGRCEVRCLGDCRVECPRGGCEVRCPRPAKAKRCGDAYVCGKGCDD